jgi:hypothetical protein
LASIGRGAKLKPKGKTGVHVKTFIKKLASALVALSMVLGAGAAQAADQTLADAELKAAYAASNIRASKTGFAVTSPPMVLGVQSKTIYSPVGNNVPANLAISISVFGTSQAIWTLIGFHTLNDLSVEFSFGKGNAILGIPTVTF